MFEVDYFVTYTLNEKDEWEKAPHFNPHKLPVPVSLPDKNLLQFREGEIVYALAKGIKRQCVVDGVLISYRFNKPENGWDIYYDLKWVGTGHTSGYFHAEEISR
jgi:hypothetical protein